MTPRHLLLLVLPCSRAFSLRSLPLAAHQMPVRNHIYMTASNAVYPDDGGSCEILGEEQESGKQWLICEDGSSPEGSDSKADCAAEEFGVGASTPYLPGDGQVLCKVDSPKAGVASFFDDLLSKLPWAKE